MLYSFMDGILVSFTLLQLLEALLQTSYLVIEKLLFSVPLL